MAAADMGETTFATFLGIYRHKCMPFGLINSPATFQRALDVILGGLRWQIYLISLDDVIVFSNDVTSHMRDVGQVLHILQNAGITLTLKTNSFFHPKVDYLAYVISSGKWEVAMNNNEAFKHAVFPKDVSQLRSFLGVANVYQRFIKDYSWIAGPLTAC